MSHTLPWWVTVGNLGSAASIKLSRGQGLDSTWSAKKFMLGLHVDRYSVVVIDHYIRKHDAQAHRARYTLANVNSLTNEATTIVSATFDGAEVGAGTLVAGEGNSITCFFAHVAARCASWFR